MKLTNLKKQLLALGAQLISYEQAINLIPTDYYIKVGEGVYDRRVKDKNDFLDWEIPIFKKHLNVSKFKDHLVLFARFDPEEFQESAFITGVGSYHSHDVDEEIYLVEGSYREDVYGKVCDKSGTSILIKAFTLHSFIPLKKGYCIVYLKSPE